MSFSTADYATLLQTCRDALKNGRRVDPKPVIEAILATMGSGNGSTVTVATNLVADISTQLTILDGFTLVSPVADILAAIQTCITVLTTDAVALNATLATPLDGVDVVDGVGGVG